MEAPNRKWYTFRVIFIILCNSVFRCLPAKSHTWCQKKASSLNGFTFKDHSRTGFLSFVLCCFGGLGTGSSSIAASSRASNMSLMNVSIWSVWDTSWQWTSLQSLTHSQTAISDNMRSSVLGNWRFWSSGFFFQLGFGGTLGASGRLVSTKFISF